MFKFQPSIRGKVNYAYYFGILLVVIIAFLNYVNLTRLNRKVELNIVISQLFDTALEIRRYEKNYFLYGHEEDYLENLRFIEKAKDIINKNREALKRLEIREQIFALETDIRDYMSLIQQHFKMKKAHSETLAISEIEEEIREKGKRIITTAETISTTEREYIQSLIGLSQRILIGSGIFLVVLGFFIAEYLYRMVIKPLELLEKEMQKIADGGFSFIPVLSRDKELISLSRAFNTMLAELELRQLHLVHSEKLASIGTFLFGIAHELNNPLSNISTSTEILKEEIEGTDIEYKRELLSQIEAETDRAMDIVRTVLEFSKTSKKEVINLKNIIKDSIRLIKGEIPTKVEIHLEVPNEIVVFSDKQKLQGVFLNLIKNAIDAISNEGKIYIMAKKGEDNMVEIRVKDTGSGIEPEIIPKIFEPFFTRKEAKGGYGLGLFVVHNIIEDHRGTIDVESRVGHGTTFLIKLPMGGKDEQ